MVNVATFALFLPEIKDLIKNKEYEQLKKMLKEINPIDLADGWTNFESQEKIIAFKLLDQKRVIEVFEELDFDEQFFIISNFEEKSLGPILEELPPKKAAYLFHKLPEKVIRKLISLMKEDNANKVKETLSFPENSAGRLMYPIVTRLTPVMTARQAVDVVRGSTKMRYEKALHNLYVTDEYNRLLGRISLKDLIISPAEIKLQQIMNPVQLIKIQVDLDQEEAARIFTKYNLVDAPVVDKENHLLGVIAVDDIMDVINQEATEDMAKLAGTEAGEIRAQSVFHVARLRMPWLLASWGGGVLASILISRFNSLLSQVVLLASFMPVITGMGGNVGTQSSTIIVRGLATGQVDLKRVWKIIFKELRVGFILGISYGVLLGVIAYFMYGKAAHLQFAFVVGLGIFTSMIIATGLGTCLPIVFHKLSIDPALATGPFVSTVTDILSIVIYLTIGFYILL
ncbi:MAG: magnesium transporter [bacterium]